VDDYALVVGVGRYPLLTADGVAGELKGPDNDARVVYDWLVSPDGGALPPANVRMIRSADFAPGDPDDPQPAAARIRRELSRIAERTEKTPGRRLYLYFSGHGFAPRLEEGALFTAEATRLLPEHVYAHAWLRWFRTSGQFQECVLWMDSCMNYQQSVPVSEVTMRVRLDTRVPGPAFVALAAQTRSALEDVMADGEVHGVFTWTLMHGLRGGACDERGRVTGESLRNYLVNVMPEFLPADARRVAAVDLQPFVRADAGIRFRRLESRPTYPVSLTLPAAADGKPLTVWTGRPPYPAVSGTVTGGAWSGELVRALYVAEVPAAGLRHGFQVSGAGPVSVTVDRVGPAVVAADQQALFHLDVVAGNRAAAVSVTDHRYEAVYADTGELHERDAPGVYKVRTQIGRDITTASDEVILLDRDTGTAGAAAVLSSPAPIPGSALSHENHAAPFEAVDGRTGGFTPPAPGRAALSVLARYWTAHPEQRPGRRLPHPMTGLRLYDADGRLLANLTTGCRIDDRSGPDPVAVWERELAPGPYYLRQTLPDGRAFEGCLTASADWVTQLALQRAGDDPAGTRIGMITDAALFTRPAGGSARPADQDAVIEAARLGLVQGRNPFGEGKGAELQELLLHTFDDPVARIIGAHLLLRAAGPEGPAPEFDAVVTGLRALVGSGHPDVEALSLRAADPALRATAAFRSPPSFAASWALVTDASYGRPDLVPDALWQRVHAASGIGAFLVWATDEQTRAAHAGQLARWMTEHAGPGPAAMPQQAWPAAAPPRPAAGLPAAAREAARVLGVPASAAADLWQNLARD
jgi:hypothetical protein